MRHISVRRGKLALIMRPELKATRRLPVIRTA
jgi:hypothetical protein